MLQLANKECYMLYIVSAREAVAAVMDHNWGQQLHCCVAVYKSHISQICSFLYSCNVRHQDIQEYRNEHTCKIVYSGLNQLSPKFVNNMFSKVVDTHNIARRSSVQNDVYVPRVKLECCKGNISVRGPMQHNRLSQDIREAKSCESI